MKRIVKQFFIYSTLLLGSLFGLSIELNHANAASEALGGVMVCGNSRTEEVLAPSRRFSRTLSLLEECSLKPFDSFKECEVCPDMVVLPPGAFEMGASERESEEVRETSDNSQHPRIDWPGRELPIHEVRFASPVAVGRFAVTFDEWDACVADGGCGGYQPSDAGKLSRRGSPGPDSGWGRGKQPVINVSWSDAQAYAAWLSRKTGQHYRLLSEAEREYATRAGTTTPFWWGNSVSPERANYDKNFSQHRGRPEGKPLPVDAFAPSPWGLYQVHGNIVEWVEDCWHSDYEGAPTDGSAWLAGHCKMRVERGGAWSAPAERIRSAARSPADVSVRNEFVGFRVARTLARSDRTEVSDAANILPRHGEVRVRGSRTEACNAEHMVGTVGSRDSRLLSLAEECSIRPTDLFKECDACPQMVVTPAG
jgi:formylglycine-generating enzyme required for sulfatase activity